MCPSVAVLAGGGDGGGGSGKGREGNYETRVLMQDYYKKGKRVGCTGDVYPGDPAMTKDMKKIVGDPGTLSTLASRTHSVYHTGKF